MGNKLYIVKRNFYWKWRVNSSSFFNYCDDVHIIICLWLTTYFPITILQNLFYTFFIQNTYIVISNKINIFLDHLHATHYNVWTIRRWTNNMFTLIQNKYFEWIHDTLFTQTTREWTILSHNAYNEIY